MKKVGDYVVYRKDVCKIAEIKEKYYRDMDYYVLIPISDESLKIEVPAKNGNGYLRDLISKEDAIDIIERIPEIEVIKCDERMIEPQYKILLNDGGHDNLIKIIKTTYLRNKERLDNKKKISDKDNYYFELAEKYLYNELGIVLDMDYDEVKDYIVNFVRKSGK